MNTRCLIPALLITWMLPGLAAAEEPHLQPVRTFPTRAEFEQQARSGLSVHREARWKGASGETYIGSARGITLQKPDGSLEPFPGSRPLPWNEVTVIAEERPGVLWIGTTRGAIRYEPADRSRPVRYFASMRWLPDDRVTGIGFEGKGSDAAVWIDTAGGVSRIRFQPMTLEEKAAAFEQRVRTRHVRHGMTASSHLRVPGDLSSNQPVSSDNDGLWTAMYLAGECYRYKVTGSSEARAYAQQGIRALMRLESISGMPGFPARSFIESGVEEQPGDGEWHPTPDGRWRWKADTSSDEIVGHYYAYAIYYDLVADEAEKQEIRAVVDRITAHIVDNGYHLIDVDGKHTLWGWWAPQEIWQDPDETGLRALHLLSHLRVAHHITGKARYEEEYDALVEKHRYALLTRNQKINYPGRVNHSDDELAFLSYYPLLRYETDPELRAIYLDSLERSWQVERPESNPLWNYIYAVGSGSTEYDALESLETLRQIPMDLVTWTVNNSHRLDVPLDPANDRHRRRQALVVLPPDERPMMKWNGNPYQVDGGNGGRSEDDGAFFLLPYWMGRYYKLIP